MDFDDAKKPLDLRFNHTMVLLKVVCCVLLTRRCPEIISLGKFQSNSTPNKIILKYNKHSRTVFLLMSPDNPSAVWLGGLLFSGTTYSMLESPIIQGRFLG